MNNVRKLILTILTVMCLGAMFFYWFGVDPVSYTHLMYLRLISNLTFGQIGEILGKSENWARVTYYRGKEKIIEEVNHE